LGYLIAEEKRPRPSRDAVPFLFMHLERLWSVPFQKGVCNEITQGVISLQEKKSKRGTRLRPASSGAFIFCNEITLKEGYLIARKEK
jgi:hypothetical protein